MKTVSGKNLCKILEKRGWTLARINGSHHIYLGPDERSGVSVPVHANKDLKPGIQRGLMKDAGLTEADL